MIWDMGPARNERDDDFYEEDEDAREIWARFDQGHKHQTGQGRAQTTTLDIDEDVNLSEAPTTRFTGELVSR